MIKNISINFLGKSFFCLAYHLIFIFSYLISIHKLTDIVTLIQLNKFYHAESTNKTAYSSNFHSKIYN